MNKHKILSLILIVTTLFFLGLKIYTALGIRNYPEINYFKNSNLTFSDLQSYFKKISETKGGLYAFDVLRVAELPPNTDIHLIAHTIGNILYKQKGVGAIRFCTTEFRNACAHTVVIGTLLDKGTSALAKISSICKTAPGGAGAYGMCFHGLGHGVLAYVGYDMAKAVEMCTTIGSKEYGYVETSECVGGVMMEMIDGVHDKKAWEAQKGNYFRKDNPLYPCDQDFIPESAKYNCYNYLTPHLWEYVGADLGNPTDANFVSAFDYCAKIGNKDEAYKDACYGGFGKEFTTLAKSRDIRKIAEMTTPQLQSVYKWCLLANNTNGTASCIRQATNSLYWGGENKPEAAIGFCNVIDNQDFKDICFEHLSGSFKYYNHSIHKLSKLCNLLPQTYENKCIAS